MAVTELTNREYNHYPLVVLAHPGNELELSVQFDTDVFDAAGIETLIERFKRVLAAMTADPTQRLSAMDVLDEGEQARLDEWGNRAVLAQPEPTSVSIPALFAAQVARRPGCGGDQLSGSVRGLIAKSMTPRIGWRTC